MLRRAIASRQYYTFYSRISPKAIDPHISRNILWISSRSYAVAGADVCQPSRRVAKGSRNMHSSVESAVDSKSLEAILAMLEDCKELDAMIKSIRSSPDLSAFFANKADVWILGERVTQKSSSVQIGRYLKVLQEMGFRLKHNTYELLCYSLASQYNWDLLLEVVQAGKLYVGRCSSRMLNWRVRALVELKEYRTLGGILDEFKQQNCTPSRRTFHLLISAHLQNHDLSSARKCLADMEEAGIPAEADTHALIVKYYRNFGSDSQMSSKALESMSNPRGSKAVLTLNSLIQICMDKNDLAGVERLLSVFDQPSIKTISEVYLGRMPVSPSNSTQSLSIYPDASTFALFISRQIAAADLPAALRVFRAMTTQGIKPDSSVFAAFVQVFCACGHVREAISLVYGICDPATPALFSHTTPSLNEEIRSNLLQVQLNRRILHALLKGILPVYGLDGAKWILRAMHANNLNPNHITLETILRYLHQKRMRPRELLRIINRLSSSSAIRPTLRHMHGILACFIRHEKYLMYGKGPNTLRSIPTGQFQEVSATYDPFAGLVPPRYLHYRSLAKPVYSSLQNRGTKADSPLLAMRIRHDAVMEQDITAAKETFRIMLSRGIRPNEYHFSALMEGYAHVGDIPAAITAMKSAERFGIKPNVVMFTILISAYARLGEPKEAIQTFEQMIDAGIVPDLFSIDATCRAFFAAGAYRTARKLLMALWSYIEPFPEELRDASFRDLVRQFQGLHNPGASQQKGKTKRREIRLKLIDILREWSTITKV